MPVEQLVFILRRTHTSLNKVAPLFPQKRNRLRKEYGSGINRIHDQSNELLNTTVPKERNRRYGDTHKERRMLLVDLTKKHP